MSNKLTSNPTTWAFFQIVIGLVLLVLFWCYWCSNNVEKPVGNLRDDMLKVVVKSKTDSFKIKDSGIYNGPAGAVANYKYTKRHANVLTQAYKAFIAEWQKKTILDSQSVERNKALINSAFEPEIAADKFNQLLAMVIMLLIIGIFLYLSINKSLLRDVVSNTAQIDAEAALRINAGDKMKVLPSFSLARTQLGIWITVISCMYVYAVLWDFYPIPGINNTALLLMGISGMTTVTGAILDTVEIQGGIPRGQNGPSKGFFVDILSDNEGISIHRFQNVVWTMVAIIVYIYRFNNPDGAPGLPDLDSTLVALTGISSATYLTLKARENVQGPVDKLKVMITLVPDASIPADIQSQLTKANGGFSKATVKLIGTTDADTLPVPFVPGSFYDFAVEGVAPGKYTKAQATWSGTDTTKTLNGSWPQVIDSKTSFPIKITMKQ